MNVLRFIGGILIAFSGFILGQKLKAKTKKHADFITGIALSIKALVSEISFLHTPPLEIFSTFSKKPQPEAEFFSEVTAQSLKKHQTVSKAWEAALGKTAPMFDLSEYEISEMMRVGEVFGRYDLEGTVAQLSAAGGRLENISEAAVSKAEKDGKLYATICTAGGIVLAILLI